MKVLVITLAIMLCYSVAYSAPSITGTPTISSDVVTIVGSSFGADGPTILLFDDFEGGTDQEDIVLTNASVGSWTSANAYNPKYDALAWSAGSTPHGNLSFQIGNLDSNGGASTEVFRQLKLNFSTVDEIFISYNFMIPDESFFPAYQSLSADEVLSPGSVWKQAWLMNNFETADNDICIPSKSDDSNWRVAGNSHLVDTVPPLTTVDPPDLMTTTYPTIPEWFQWDKFTKMDTWIKANSVDPYSWTSTLNVSMLAEGKGMTQYTYNDNVRVLGDELGWTDLVFPGWMRLPDTDIEALKVAPVYDDIYVAIGPNAAARVEIGDNAVYENCTKLAIQTPTAWSDTGITSDIQLGPFAEDANVYVFVIDADNIPSAGVLVSLSASQITNVHASGGSVASSGGSVSVTVQ